jgi:hypothetical protein
MLNMEPKDASQAWKSPWVLFNCFLAVASLDDSRIWGQMLAWIRRRRRLSTIDFVPPPTTNVLKGTFYRVAASLGLYPGGCTGYAYWLFEQDDRVYNYTGRCALKHSCGHLAYVCMQTGSGAMKCRGISAKQLASYCHSCGSLHPLPTHQIVVRPAFAAVMWCQYYIPVFCCIFQGHCCLALLLYTCQALCRG